MKIGNNYELTGKIIKDTETYKLIDNTTLNRLTVSTTELYAGRQTGGHSHENQEEVYIFLSGKGNMLLGDQTIPVNSGDVVTVPVKTFHQVKANSGSSIYFMCVFEGERNHISRSN